MDRRAAGEAQRPRRRHLHAGERLPPLQAAVRRIIDDDTHKVYGRDKINEYVRASYSTEGEYVKINRDNYVKIDKFYTEFVQ